MNKEKELELEFIIAAKKANELIRKKIEEASKKLQEAIQISEQYGIPFDSEVSPLSNTYTPRSFEDKYGSINKEIMYLNDFASGSSYSSGWEHSAVC